MNTIDKTGFELYILEKDPQRQVQRINVYKKWNPEYNIGIKDGKIHILTDLWEGRTSTGIDLLINDDTEKDWGLSLWVINQLLLRFELGPENLSIRKECQIDKESLLSELNIHMLPDPYEEFTEEDEAEMMEELKKTEENPF